MALFLLLLGQLVPGEPVLHEVPDDLQQACLLRGYFQTFLKAGRQFGLLHELFFDVGIVGLEFFDYGVKTHDFGFGFEVGPRDFSFHLDADPLCFGRKSHN